MQLLTKATGYVFLLERNTLGYHLANAIIDQGYWLRILVREKLNATERDQKLSQLKARNCEICKGDISDLESVKQALKGVSVVISAIGIKDIHHQKALIPVLKEYNDRTHQLKRFIPSEFGFYYIKMRDETNQVVSMFQPKAEVQKLVQESGIPYTFVCNGLFAEFVWGVTEKQIAGNGNTKGFVTTLRDVATITVKAALDERTVNKTLGIVGQVMTQNELIRVYESIRGKSKTERPQVSGEMLMKQFQEAMSKGDTATATHYLLVKSLWIDGGGLEELKKVGVLANDLYPDYQFTNMETFFKQK